ncbi:DUF5681 domain-containing protein [Aestuariivirga sp. YIM B02566]|uniref:Uncharacterized protein n=1 Tax=Taklimakanibacter albus TaxID=2800327 RepID=A0ACC5RF31_9HYPH|nr:DUF5681 domain-containing protein [Aestuariivirga sp. YIM B02566]MBK1871217.1 hypothetical protein [Aestuariivirga sp. YIM B02566]
MTDNARGPEGGEARVGYGRPPKSGQFRKGVSGNPKGKPKGAKNRPRAESEQLRALIRREAYRPVKVRIDGTELTMPLAQAALRSLGTAALSGETRALAIFLKILSAGAAEEDAVMEEILEEARETEKPVIRVRIVDAVDGRAVPTDEVLYPYGGGPAQRDRQDK